MGAGAATITLRSFFGQSSMCAFEKRKNSGQEHCSSHFALFDLIQPEELTGDAFKANL